MVVGKKNFIKVRQEMIADARRLGARNADLRQTGKSTGLALRAIGSALCRPGEWVPIHDHYDSREADRNLARRAMLMVEVLGLEGFKYSANNNAIRYDYE